jgi:hypothetical protein
MKAKPNKAVHSTLTHVTSLTFASLLGRSRAMGERKDEGSSLHSYFFYHQK